MNNTFEKRFEMQGAQFPDQQPFLAITAKFKGNSQFETQINFNSLNQVQKAKLSLNLIKQLAVLSQESLQQLEPVPNSPVGWVVESMKDMIELSDRAFEVLQPPDAQPSTPELP